MAGAASAGGISTMKSNRALIVTSGIDQAADDEHQTARHQVAVGRGLGSQRLDCRDFELAVVAAGAGNGNAISDQQRLGERAGTVGAGPRQPIAFIANGNAGLQGRLCRIEGKLRARLPQRRAETKAEQQVGAQDGGAGGGGDQACREHRHAALPNGWLHCCPLSHQLGPIALTYTLQQHCKSVEEGGGEDHPDLSSPPPHTTPRGGIGAAQMTPDGKVERYQERERQAEQGPAIGAHWEG